MSKFLTALVIVFLAYFTLLSIKTPNACEEHIVAVHPISKGYLVIDSIRVRAQNERLISAIVYQPKDMTKEPITYACRFASMQGGDIELETYQGNKLEMITDTSTFVLFGYF
jgi:hypothetical protein